MHFVNAKPIELRYRISPLVEDLIKVSPVEVSVLQDGGDVRGIISLGVIQQCVTQLMDLLVLGFVALVLTRNLLKNRDRTESLFKHLLVNNFGGKKCSF